MEQESIQPSQEIEPLTQVKEDGTPYRRETKVEEQIRWALTLSREALLSSLYQAESGENGFLNEETLVYLIRAYYKVHQRDIVQELWNVLYRRCVKMIRSKIPQVDQRSSQAYQEIQFRLFNQIIHLDGEQGDMLQAHFWVGFRSLVITVARSLIKDIQKDNVTEPLTNLPGEELEQEEQESEDAEPGATRRSLGMPSDIPIERRVIALEGLSLVPEPFKKAFILHYGLGYPVESNDPDEKTVSKILGKSPRTIYYWLGKAEEILKQWRGDTHEKAN